MAVIGSHDTGISMLCTAPDAQHHHRPTSVEWGAEPARPSRRQRRRRRRPWHADVIAEGRPPSESGAPDRGGARRAGKGQ